jgi:hypothetical protein
MTTDIQIVSCAKHFPRLKYCLRSIDRFAKGFRQVKLLVPHEDLTALTALLSEFSTSTNIEIRIKTYDDWPGKGFLRHEHVIMCSDQFSDADFILHFDSDCVFTAPITPEDYMIADKPVLMYASYHWLVTSQQANLGMWQATVQNAIGGTSVNEFMRRHPAIHHRKTYAKARECIQAHTGKDPADYIKSCEEAFPQGFCEFNTLGEVAWRHFPPGDYRFWNQETEGFIKPNNVVQFWSHGSPDQPQKPYYKDQPFECTPASLLAML